MEKYIAVIVIGTLGGWAAEKVGFPGGAVVGSMLAAGAVVLCFSNPVTIHPKVGLGVQLMLGISLGMSIDRTLLETAGKVLPLAIISTLILLTVAICMAFVADKLNLIDFATALFGFSPGGMSGMSILAQSEGHKGSLVALLHLVRIFTLFLIVPQLGRLFLFISEKLR